MTAVLEIRLFGGLEICRGGAPIGGFVSSKAPALLAYLVITGRPHQREALAALLWGEMTDADAKNNLRQTLSNLRKLVDPHLIITRETVGWNTAVPYTLDAAQFENHLQAGRASNSRHFTGLAAAASLYRGDFLAGFFVRDAPEFEEWMLAQRARYRELALHALHSLTEYHISRGEYGRAIDCATRLLALDAWREESHRQLMLAFIRSGQRTAALKQYETCRRILNEELGAEPSNETTALYERIRAAGTKPRHNLPLHPTAFVGREAELVRMESWLADASSHLLTVIGPGGVGKTRLALQAAQAHTADFLEGVWFVSLVPVADKSSLVTAVAAAIGFQFASADRLDEQLLDYLRGKEMLLLLDNLEHLLNGRNLSLLATLLTQAPAVKLLVTSRERLNLQAETLLELHGLPYSVFRGPDSERGEPDDRLRLQVTQSPAVQLFVERARQVQADFQPAGQETALLHLCRLVDGLPLALELAASWVRALDVPGIAVEIERGLDFLSGGLHDLPERHRSLQAVFDYSWQLLTPQERAAYAALSVFRGGFSREAALAVADSHLPLLAGLVDKSLLRRDNGGPFDRACAEPGEVLSAGRYRRHPLLLQFATTKLAANPTLAAQAKQNHARYFGRFIREQEPVLIGGRPDDALILIRPELENLRLAWQTAVEYRDTAVINDLADSFMQIFDLMGLYQEMRDLAGQAIAALDSHVDPAQAEEALALGRAYGLSAAFHFRLGEYQKAMAHCQESLQLIAPFQPHVAYGHSLTYAGAAAFGLGDFGQVVDYWQTAVTAYQAAGSIWGECTALLNLAEAMLALGDTAVAQKNAAAAYTLAQKMENAELMANTLAILSSIALQEGEFEKAAAHGQEALVLHQRVGHKAHLANDMAILAHIAKDRGDAFQALSYLNESVMILRQIGNRLYLKQRLVELGRVALAAGQSAVAEAALQEALDQVVPAKVVTEVLEILLLLARLRKQQGQWRIALGLAGFVACHELATAEMRATAEICRQTLAAHLTEDEVTAVLTKAVATSLAEIAVKGWSV